MIDRYRGPDEASHCLVLRSDTSLSWRGNKIFLLIATAYAGVAGVAFAWMGLWPILPFAGAEVGVLWAVTYWFKLHQQRREVLYLTEDEIVLQRGRTSADTEIRLPRYWTRLIVHQGRTDAYAKRLYLRCRGRDIEVGRALGPHDRDALADHLSMVLTPVHLYPGARPSGFEFG